MLINNLLSNSIKYSTLNTSISLVESIVKEHEYRLEIDAEVREGTSITLHFS